MSEILKHILQNKEILILGYGLEGQATYKVIRKLFPDLALSIADKDDNLLIKYPLLKTDPYLNLICGPEYLDFLQNFNLIIKSPGISPKLFPYTPPTENMSSQTELFITAFREQIIGVTVTKGKSTTSSLIAHLLNKHFPHILLAGNIGTPPFEMIDDIRPETIIVYEMSSHQLEQTAVSPHIAVILNIFEEHLDHYKNYDAYQQAKINITRFQQEHDYLVYVADNILLKGLIIKTKPVSKPIPVSLSNKSMNGIRADHHAIYSDMGLNPEKLIDINDQIPLRGDHNLLNIMCALAVCKILDMPLPEIKESLTGFKPLEHRMEYFGDYNGIHFYNDSIATIPEATEAAIRALGDVDTVILGGVDRGIDYSGLASFIPASGINNLIFVGEAGTRIHKLLIKHQRVMNFFTATDYSEVVNLAMAKTERGKICLLSPAAASYDWFRNFEERGKVFKLLVAQYNSELAFKEK
ncbi:MAG: UDP-N-acetylmuramoyl-L-alanine--D-glutamate ligase [Bacteroidota bacterium]